MNIPISFLILNPLEALVVIMGCDIFTNRKFNISKDIKHVYILGTINLIIQILINLFEVGISSLILNILIPFIISPYITKIYYNRYLGNIKYCNVFIVQAIYMVTTAITIYLFNFIFNNIYITIYINTLYDLATNLTKSFIQVLIIYTLRRIKMKNIKTTLIKLASCQVNEAFTWWNSYTPEMPKSLKKEIEDKIEK